MKDINGIEILPGMVVRTKQPEGGLLPPAPAVVGVVTEYYNKVPNEKYLVVNYTKCDGHTTYNAKIRLDNQINEVIS